MVRPALLGGAVVVLALLPVAAPEVVVVHMTDFLIFTLFALSLNLLVGYAGMLSMGHAAFFAIGGYTAGLLVKHLGVAMWPALLAGPVAAAVAALVIGYFCVRLTHAYFIMLTLAFGQLVFTVIWKWQSATGGDDGLTGIAPHPLLATQSAYYAFVLVVVLACAWALYRIGRSPFGRALLAIKDNPRRAAFLGIDVRRVQLAAFVVAGTFAGIAGALQAFYHRGMFPSAAHWLFSADGFVAVCIGGANFFFGPVVGSALLKIVQLAGPRVTEYWLFVLGGFILFVALVRPAGLLSLAGSFRRPTVRRHA
jgi:branched-chain amino acid transport system permease protein